VDEAVVAELYRANVQAARAFAVAITGDPATAEDLVQDAFVRCVRRLSTLRDRDSFRTYLLRAVANAANSYFKRRRVERGYLAHLAALAGVDEGTAGGSDLTQREPLLAALRTLPVRQRTAVAARFLLDRSEAQTAELMNCRIGTVKSLTSRGLAALRAHFDAKENSPHA
jgi:RNA polymerase sigma factor (sigma-70 family)